MSSSATGPTNNSSATTSELQSFIGQWRRLIAQLKEENALLEKAREELSAKEDELRLLTNEWEETKTETQEAVMKVTAEINASKNEVATLETQTENLNSRIQQRQEKTAQYKTILATKNAEIESTKERIFAEEEGIRQRLAVFRSCREDLRNELREKIARIDEISAKEEEESKRKAAFLEKRARHLENVIENEQRQWEAEKDRRDKEDKIMCLTALRNEISAAQKSKNREINFLRDSSSLKLNIQQSVNEIESLLSALQLREGEQ